MTCSGLFAACEDGPLQTYVASPKGAADRWNDGKAAGVADRAAKQDFTGDFAGGANKQEICTGEQRAKRWAEMVKAPIMPPTQAAGIDGVGGLDWKGLTLEVAEKINCQSETLGDEFGDGSLVNSWGDNGEVWVKYNVANHNKIEWITLNMGYEGNLEFKSRDGKDKFVIHLGTQITKNGKNFTLDWTDKADFAVKATEIADGLFATYSPDLPKEDPATGSCIANGHCTQTVFPEVGALRIWPLGMHIWVDNPTSPQPTPSKFNRIDLRLPRIMPFSLGRTVLKLDAQGPTTTISGLGSGKNCEVALGLTWDKFLANCVNVTGDPAKDKVAYNKLTGNIAHDAEKFIFDSSGVDVDFQSSTVAQFDILRDEDRPVPADKAVSLTMDANTLGHFANDWSDDDKTHDLHGSGAVYYEFARLVQAEINAQLKAADPKAVTHELGDPACLWPDDTTYFDPKSFTYAANCTGFEGFVSAMPKATTATVADPKMVKQLNRVRLGPDAALVVGALGMKPGKPLAAFCVDANADLDTGYYHCGDGEPYGKGGSLWDTSFDRVREVLGKGDVHNLPPEVRDRRFYFRMYVIALVKYLIGSPDGKKVDLAGVEVDPNNLFFDSEGAGQYEFAEFIDRRFVTAALPPLDFVVKADILNGTLYDYNFDRFMYRDESAMYSSVLENKSDPPGKENDLTLTSVFGSPVLAAAYADTADKSAYECASADWKTQDEMDAVSKACEGQLPPLDPNYVANSKDPKAPAAVPLREGGKPILAPYKGAFAGTSTVFGLGSTSLEIEQIFPFLQAVKLKINRTIDPYGGKKLDKPIEVLVEPWVAPQPGVGFGYPINGQQDKLVQAGWLDFTGITTSFSVFYQKTDKTKASGIGPVRIVAVDSIDYLGDVFLCQDPATKDFLRVKMYGSVQTVVDWIDSHPGVYDACGLIVRYSPYNNFPDYIISTVNGVKVGVTQGGGYGRVNDASLWLPGEF